MPRSSRVRHVVGAALALVLLTAASPAAAESTPTPSSTPTVSSSASPSPSPAGTTATPTPKPSTRPPTTRTGKRRALPRGAQWIVDLAERARGPQTRRPPRGLAEDDGQPTALVAANCVPATGPTTAEAYYIVLDTDDDVAFSWSVTGPAGVVDSGRSTGGEDLEPFEIANLTRGQFTLTITEDGPDALQTTTTFEVLGCVTTSVSCKAVSFANPVGNPRVAVLYGRPAGGRLPDEYGLVDLGGRADTATVRTALPAISWLGIAGTDYFDEDGEDENDNIALAGRVESLAVPGDCDAPFSTLQVSCVHDHPRLTATLAREDSEQPVQLTVANRRGKIIARGEPDFDQTRVRLRLPGPGRYTYRSYFEKSAAYETVPVQVAACRTATAGGGLADTGGSPLLPLPFGAALLVAGVALLTRRTRPVRPAAPHRRRPTRGR